MTAVPGISETLIWPEDESEIGRPAKVSFNDRIITFRLDTQPMFKTQAVQVIQADNQRNNCDMKA